MPSASTASARPASASSMTSVGGKRRPEAGHAYHRRLVAQLSEHAVSRAFEGLSGHDGRNGYHVVAAGLPRRPRYPAIARTGPMETIGLDGQMTITSASAMAARTPGAGRAASAPANRTACTAHARGGGRRSTPGSRSLRA